MHLIGATSLGVTIVLLLAALVIVKQIATGAILDRPQGSLLVQLVNVFNLFFLLIVNPLAAVGLLLGRLEPLDPTHVEVQAGGLLVTLEIAGLVIYVAGFALMGWALLTLRRNYQLGGSAPRAGDRMVVDGPYALIRHPMYSAALAIALGLACLLQSLAFLAVFVIYLALIVPLISTEERGLEAAYGAQYAQYRKHTRKLVPAIY